MKTNAMMRREIAMALRVSLRSLPRFSFPRKKAHSVDDGCRMLSNIASRGDLIIHPRCEALIDAFDKFDGDKYSVHKDVLDAARYPAERACREELVRAQTFQQTHREAS